MCNVIGSAIMSCSRGLSETNIKESSMCDILKKDIRKVFIAKSIVAYFLFLLLKRPLYVLGLDCRQIYYTKINRIEII